LQVGDRVLLHDGNGACFDGLAYVVQIEQHNGIKGAFVVLKDHKGQANLIFLYQPITMQWVANCGHTKIFLEK